MRSRKNKKNRRPNSKQSKSLGYDNLEDRRVLATLVSLGGADLTISMNANSDVAQVGVATNGNITVNGSQDIDTGTAGVQTSAAAAVRSITVNGDSSKAAQTVTLNDSYTLLNTLSVQDVNRVTVNGDYQTNNFSVTLVGVNGELGDGTSGRVRANGLTTIRSNNNAVLLNNANNDFNTVDVVNGGTNRAVTMVDTNGIQFSNLISTGNLVVTAGGNITDLPGTNVTVSGFTTFNAANVVLGDNSSDTTNFMALSSTTTGDLTLTEDSPVTLLNVSADNLTVNTTGGIFDGRRTSINVASQSTFNGATVRVGENGSDTFNTGTLSFNSPGHVQIIADTALQLTDASTANSLTLFSQGSITDDATSSLAVTNIAHFEGADIILGDAAGDNLTTGSVHFYTWGDMDIDQDSPIHIIETKNEARRMFLTSNGAITNSDNAQVTVQRIADFTAPTVNVGFGANDRFDAGSISFTTVNAAGTGRFSLSEDSSTNIVGFNDANRSQIDSAGTITNVFQTTDGSNLGTSIDVTNVASFSGSEIDLGQQNNDSMTFGALQFNSTGTTSISEDDSTHVTQNNTADDLNLTSAGAITDATAASIAVADNANVRGTSIRWGENAADNVTAGTVTLNADGAAELTADSRIHMVASSAADSMLLASNTGNVTDGMDAQTRVANLLQVRGTLINLGSETTDVLQMGQFNFNSGANTFVTTDAAFEIIGDNRAGDRLTLVSDGAITDADDAKIQAENFATFDGTSVLIGESLNDCFEIVGGGLPSVIGGSVTSGGC